jgi:hypothetical protein
MEVVVDPQHPPIKHSDKRKSTSGREQINIQLDDFSTTDNVTRPINTQPSSNPKRVVVNQLGARNFPNSNQSRSAVDVSHTELKHATRPDARANSSQLPAIGPSALHHSQKSEVAESRSTQDESNSNVELISEPSQQKIRHAQSHAESTSTRSDAQQRRGSRASASSSTAHPPMVEGNLNLAKQRVEQATAQSQC